MISIAWCDKLRISLKYLKQFFLAPRFRKCLEVVNELVGGEQVWLCILIETWFCRAETGGDLS